ncbi:hypothetical protein [Sphingomonas koreensis]|jgi:hypothetical protein|nr:hypothetical protein [Sphingomonas koreensis]MDC7808955.1 hypothetical protein [Sphingomonas koreensis]
MSAYAVAIALAAVVMTFATAAFHRARARHTLRQGSLHRQQRLLGWWRR